MVTGRASVPAFFTIIGLALVGLAVRAGDSSKDPLVEEVARWAAFLHGNRSTDETWTQVKKDIEPALARAETALREGRRWLALQRLAPVQQNLAAAAYVQERRAEAGKDLAAFEAEWKRFGLVLRDDLGPPPRGALDGVRPAAARALAEAALLQVRVYYEASLEYGRSTTPEYGLFYLGAAQADRAFVSFCRTLSSPEAGAAPSVRSVAQELDALEAEMLAAYRPPASIDRHPEFIGVSSAVKEARELDAAGLRYGALLRYLQAALRFATLRPPNEAPGRDETARRLQALRPRIAGGPVDHTLGRIFLDSAEADLAATAPDGAPATASAIVQDVLPRYFAALEPETRRPEAPTPQATVTLVRWPYT